MKDLFDIFNDNDYSKMVWDDKLALAKGSIATWNSQGTMDAAGAFQKARSEIEMERER